MTRSLPRLALAALALGAFAAPAVFAGAHTWDVNELFSNASGTIQFIELKETGGGAGETGVGGHQVTSNINSFTILSNVVAPTSFKHILFGTAAFAALPGAPMPNYIIDPNFFSVSGDLIQYMPYDSLSFAAGVLPTDGVLSLGKGGVTAQNSPTNYAGQTGSVNANPPTPPPGVPDGAGGTTPMTVTALDLTGSSLQIAWDTASCTGDTRFHLVYGQGSDLPNGPGLAYALAGSLCAMTASPFVWNSVPAATDGTGLIWWLILADDGTTVEGSWGQSSALAERIGPGIGGCSGVCGVTSKSLTNTCGH